MQKQLAKDIEVDPRNMVATINKLSDRGWIISLANETDGRSKIIDITVKGQNVLQNLYAHLLPMEERFLQNLTESEKNQLQMLLIKLKG